MVALKALLGLERVARPGSSSGFGSPSRFS